MAMMTKAFSICTGFASVFLLLASLDALPVSLHKGYLYKMPIECDGEEFCFSSVGYPAKHIEKLLTEDYRVTLGGVREEFQHRDGFDDTYQVDCPKTTHYDPVYEMIDEKGLVRIVVQSEKHFAQILRLETCNNPGRLTESTKHFSANMVEKFTITCEQRRLPYKFLVLNLEGTGFEWVNSRTGVPVECACLVE